MSTRLKALPKVAFTLSAEDFKGGPGDSQGDGPTCLLGHLGRQFGGGCHWEKATKRAPKEAVMALYQAVAEARCADTPVDPYDYWVYVTNDSVSSLAKAPFVRAGDREYKQHQVNKRNNERRARIWNRAIEIMGYTEDSRAKIPESV